MPDRYAPTEMAAVVRRWAAGLRDAGPEDLDHHIGRIVGEIQAMLADANGAADERFSSLYRDSPAGPTMSALPRYGARLGARLDELAASGAGGQVALLLMDLDGFAVVRDGLGFDGAHEVLLGVADRLRGIFAGHRAFVSHLFGDLFAVGLSGDHPRDEVAALAERAIGELAKPAYVDGLGVGVSASVGIALAGTPAAASPELIRSAQIALHRAKELGGTRWVLFDAVSGAADRERYRLACGLAGALDAGEISVIYRPKAVLPDARLITTLNAALRWRHPTRGELAPEQLYPLAEATGMTVTLGRYLLAEALRAAGGWQARYGEDAPRVCLNLPRRLAIDSDLVRLVDDELERNGLAHRHLTLCTDGPSLLDERGDLLESLRELAEAGVTFIVDITGMTELELLPALKVPAPAVMLTGQIIDALEIDDPPGWAVRTIGQLVERARELGIMVGAHGVLSQEHAEVLAGVGVVVAAGPYLPTYATVAEAETWAGRVLVMA